MATSSLSYFILISLLLTAVACGKKKNKSRLPESETTPIQERPLKITQEETVNIVRKRQMISRYDCSGHLTSRKLETINSLSKKISINYEHKKKAWSYTVYNRRTKSAQKGLFVKVGQFIIDYAPTLFNMRVEEGINDVEYAFYRCTEITEEKCTGKLELEEEGIVQIDVTYSSEEVAGERHIYSDEDDCKKEE